MITADRLMPQRQIGKPCTYGEDTRKDERHAPTAIVDQISGDQCRAGDAQISPDTVCGYAHAGIAPRHGDNGEANRMIDRGEHANHEQTAADLYRRCSKAGCDRGQANPDKEHNHHPVAAPPVCKPSGGQ